MTNTEQYRVDFKNWWGEEANEYSVNMPVSEKMTMWAWKAWEACAQLSKPQPTSQKE